MHSFSTDQSSSVNLVSPWAALASSSPELVGRRTPSFHWPVHAVMQYKCGDSAFTKTLPPTPSTPPSKPSSTSHTIRTPSSSNGSKLLLLPRIAMIGLLRTIYSYGYTHPTTLLPRWHKHSPRERPHQEILQHAHPTLGLQRSLCLLTITRAPPTPPKHPLTPETSYVPAHHALLQRKPVNHLPPWCFLIATIAQTPHPPPTFHHHRATYLPLLWLMRRFYITMVIIIVPNVCLLWLVAMMGGDVVLHGARRLRGRRPFRRRLLQYRRQQIVRPLGWRCRRGRLDRSTQS